MRTSGFSMVSVAMNGISHHRRKRTFNDHLLREEAFSVFSKCELLLAAQEPQLP